MKIVIYSDDRYMYNWMEDAESGIELTDDEAQYLKSADALFKEIQCFLENKARSRSRSRCQNLK